MSVPSNYVSRSNPQIPVDQGIYEESTTQKAGIGTRLAVGDRVFYYAKAGTNLVAGNVVCAPSNIATQMGATVAVDTGALSKKTITITAGTNISANAFAEGYVSVCSSGLAGGGVLLRVKSHSAISSGATTGTINLYDGLPVATVAAGPVNLIQNPYNSAIIGSQVLDLPIGVAPIAVTSGNYFWAQSWGIASPIHTAATPAAADITLGTLGTVVALRTATEGGGATVRSIGKNINLAATANFCNPVFLAINP